ncbi:MAG: hypothetical protein E6Q50_14355 [Lysobacter sp.]|nr:MAG: hypothetical protein E6Q50_14355 [Lysobacter sp.]
MASRIKYNDALGQHMTPARIAQLLCEVLPVPFGMAVDLAVGHGDLLLPLRERWPDIALFGVDCDAARLARASDAIGKKNTRLSNGLTAKLPNSTHEGRFLAILNPPFLPTEPLPLYDRLLAQAFPGVESGAGRRRLEMVFLARALLEARARAGWVAIILPSIFVSGLRYAPYRQALLSSSRVVKAIEIREGRFRDTEATTVLLVIDTSSQPTHVIEIDSYDLEANTLTPVYHGPIGASERLDATYWQAAHLHHQTVPTLRDVGVEIARGRRSFAEAGRVRHRLVHTTDLSQLSGYQIRLHRYHGTRDDVFAEAGDILLARTGTRVRWVPVRVADGRAPITDHVLRIRAPKGYRRALERSFRHPDFDFWLRSISKGVCATVLTKHELLNMPLFALEAR